MEPDGQEERLRAVGLKGPKPVQRVGDDSVVAALIRGAHALALSLQPRLLFPARSVGAAGGMRVEIRQANRRPALVVGAPPARRRSVRRRLVPVLVEDFALANRDVATVAKERRQCVPIRADCPKVHQAAPRPHLARVGLPTGHVRVPARQAVRSDGVGAREADGRLAERVEVRSVHEALAKGANARPQVTATRRTHQRKRLSDSTVRL